MDKKAYNPIKDKGFDSKAQVRLLLMRARELPNEYKWVYDALREHGLPDEDGPLKTYWDAPYKISPDTPSYKYVSPKDKSVFKKRKKYKADIDTLKLQKIATNLNNLGYSKAAILIDRIAASRFYVDYALANKIANQFWTIVKDRSQKDRQLFALELWKKLEKFKPFQEMDLASQIAIKNAISQKLMDGE